MNLTNIQTAMQEENMDCWVVYDFQRMNPIMAQFLRDRLMFTRRVFLIIPSEGEPTILGSKIDNDLLQTTPFGLVFYTSWREMENQLKQLLTDYQVIGLDYSPNGMLPTASRVDAGTVEMIKNLGKDIVSSANVFQAGMAVWEPAALEAHLEDCQIVGDIKDEAFQFLADQLRENKSVTEYDVQSFIMRRFEEANLFTPHAPIVGVNEYSSDPHYVPNAKKHAPIKKGDWILIDLFAKRPGYEFIFADITWVAYAGVTPSAKQQEVFKVVTGARDVAVAYLQSCTDQNIEAEGWQVDDITRNHITEAGYGDYFFHRTGHSLGPGDHAHGMGVNIDNLETHDIRKLKPGIGFSIEPGVYLPEFGVRAEINVYMDQSGPRVTTPIQYEIICLEV